MMLDKQLTLSASQVVADGTATASTNYVDLGAAKEIHGWEPVGILVRLQAAGGGVNPVLTITVETDDDSAFGSATVVSSITPPATAAGQWYLPLPKVFRAKERYIRVKYDFGSDSGTPGGTVDAYVVLGAQNGLC